MKMVEISTLTKSSKPVVLFITRRRYSYSRTILCIGVSTVSKVSSRPMRHSIFLAGVDVNRCLG
jgi:hypothetical protein